ncbi:MAG: MFS transporter [Alicyclobacillaceae bacterium]|nr:MFS transporter [Alicyclobacillaceae bacterium]
MKYGTLGVVTAAVFLDTVVYGTVVPIIPLYLEEIRAPAWGLGAVFAAYSVGLLAGGVPFGILSDRWGRRPVLILGLAGLLLTTLAFAFSPTVWLLILSRFLQGLAAAAIWSSGLALVADIAPADRRGRYLSIAMVGTNLGTITGPVFGGTVAAWFGRPAPFLALSAASLVLLAALAVFRGSAAPWKDDPPSTRQLLTVPHIRWGAATVTAGAFGYGILEPLLPGDLHNRFGLDMSGVGLTFGVMSAVYTAVQPVLGWLSDIKGHRAMIVAGLLSSAALGPAIPLAPGIASAGAALTLFGIATGVMMTPCMPMMAAAAERRFGSGGYGAAFGIVNTAYSVGLAAAPLIATPLADWIGFPAVMILYGLALCALALGLARGLAHRGAVR